MEGQNYGDYTLYEVTYHTDEGDLHCYQTGMGVDFSAAETPETTAATEAPATEAAATETAVTEAVATEAAATETAVTEAAATEAAATETAVTEAAATETAATEAAVTEAAATEAPAAGDAAVQTAISVLDSAIMILEQDVTANAATGAELIRTAAEIIRASSPGAAGILDSAKVLLESGAADFSSVKTLIDTAKGMM